MGTAVKTMNVNAVECKMATTDVQVQPSAEDPIPEVEQQAPLTPAHDPESHSLTRAHALNDDKRSQDVAKAQLLRTAEAEQNVELLPPYYKTSERRAFQSMTGPATITLKIVMICGTTHAVALVVGDLPDTLWWICFVMLYTEAFCAFCCLFKIVCGGSSEVHRTPLVCFPVPDEFLSKLEKGDQHISNGLQYWTPRCQDQHISNVSDVAGGRTYCVRCLVWRPDIGPGGLRSHHCSVCQRCVTDFDHHCGFYGRCIAGSNSPTRPGNMFPFKLIIVCAVLGCCTGVIFIVIALAYRFD